MIIMILIVMTIRIIIHNNHIMVIHMIPKDSKRLGAAIRPAASER